MRTDSSNSFGQSNSPVIIFYTQNIKLLQKKQNLILSTTFINKIVIKTIKIYNFFYLTVRKFSLNKKIFNFLAKSKKKLL